MSWRQAARNKASAAAAVSMKKRRMEVALMRHLRDAARIHAFQERADGDEIEFRIRCLDAQEEAIARGESESRRIKERVERHGQAVQGQHAERAGESGEQDRHFKCNGNERGPGVEGAAA